jgi:hypothetical protein
MLLFLLNEFLQHRPSHQEHDTILELYRCERGWRATIEGTDHQCRGGNLVLILADSQSIGLTVTDDLRPLGREFQVAVLLPWHRGQAGETTAIRFKLPEAVLIESVVCVLDIHQQRWRTDRVDGNDGLRLAAINGLRGKNTMN